MLVTVNCSRFAFVVVTTEHVPLPSVVHIATFPRIQIPLTPPYLPIFPGF